MKEYIVKADFITEGEELVSPDMVSELIRCKDCRHRIVTASIEHNDGEVTEYYMCNYWHRLTDPEGFCHIAKHARYDSD